MRDIKELLYTINYPIVWWLGGMLAHVRINSVVYRMEDKARLCIKKRHWYNVPLIWTGNMYLWMQGANVQVLLTSRWHSWEQEVHKQLYDREVFIDSEGQLIFTAWPGEILADILQSSSYGFEQKLVAVKLAIKALKRLHSHNIQWFNGKTKRLSHGDATVNNVICDLNTTSAFWFDFDTVHNMEISFNQRAADDLRALIYSVATYVIHEELEKVVQAILQEYNDRSILLKLGEMIKWWKYRPITYHLAQGRVNRKKKEYLETLIIAGIKNMHV